MIDITTGSHQVASNRTEYLELVNRDNEHLCLQHKIILIADIPLEVKAEEVYGFPKSLFILNKQTLSSLTLFVWLVFHL